MSRLPLFYLPVLESTGRVEITGDTAHHISTVLRMKVGEKIRLSDGAGKYSDAIIDEVTKKVVCVQLEKLEEQQVILPLLSIIQAIPKSDRIKETLELLTEVGVNEITPWQSERSIGKFPADGDEKWRNAIRASSIQARRANIPQLLPVQKLSEIIQSLQPSDLVFICHESAPLKFSAVLSSLGDLSTRTRIIMVIGPEGGISDEEITTFLQHPNSYLVSLGEIVFRSAHAGIAALSALQLSLGRW